MNKTVRIALAAFTLAALMTADTLVTMALVKRRENRAASAPAYSTVLDDPMARFRLEREQLRARQEAQLNDIIHADDGDEENAARARGQLLDMLDHARTESNLEGILQSRGFEEALVSVSDTAANVLIRGQTPTLGESAVILDLVMRETGLTGGNVKIIPVK